MEAENQNDKSPIGNNFSFNPSNEDKASLALLNSKSPVCAEIEAKKTAASCKSDEDKKRRQRESSKRYRENIKSKNESLKQTNEELSQKLYLLEKEMIELRNEVKALRSQISISSQTGSPKTMMESLSPICPDGKFTNDPSSPIINKSNTISSGSNSNDITGGNLTQQSIQFQIPGQIFPNQPINTSPQQNLFGSNVFANPSLYPNRVNASSFSLPNQIIGTVNQDFFANGMLHNLNYPQTAQTQKISTFLDTNMFNQMPFQQNLKQEYTKILNNLNNGSHSGSNSFLFLFILALPLLMFPFMIRGNNVSASVNSSIARPFLALTHHDSSIISSVINDSLLNNSSWERINSFDNLISNSNPKETRSSSSLLNMSKRKFIDPLSWKSDAKFAEKLSSEVTKNESTIPIKINSDIDMKSTEKKGNSTFIRQENKQRDSSGIVTNLIFDEIGYNENENENKMVNALKAYERDNNIISPIHDDEILDKYSIVSKFNSDMDKRGVNEYLAGLTVILKKMAELRGLQKPETGSQIILVDFLEKLKAEIIEVVEELINNYFSVILKECINENNLFDRNMALTNTTVHM